MMDRLRVAVVGIGHLADATRECVARHFRIVPVPEAEVLWIAIDTPVNTHDESDVDTVLEQTREAIDESPPGALTVISSQLPVGTCARIEAEYPERHIATQPENIRIAHAVTDFESQTRIVVGTRHPETRPLLARLFAPFTDDVQFMSPESAEMTKHALNVFLAMEIAYANEIADLCAAVGADTGDVSAGLRSDRRVGCGPLRPGGPYRGGTLGRDVRSLLHLGAGPVIRGIAESNARRLT